MAALNRRIVWLLVKDVMPIGPQSGLSATLCEHVHVHNLSSSHMNENVIFRQI